jgi:hypothetical protein
MASGSQYCLDFTTAGSVTNNSTPGNYTVSIADGTDSTSVGIDVISNDQIVVSATVAPTFTLTFPGNTDSLGTLSSGSVSVSTGVALSVTTNAANGWGLWAEDANANGGLHSAASGGNLAWVTAGGLRTLSAGTPNYAVGVTTGNGTANYNSNGTTQGGALSNTAWDEIASAGSPGSSVGVTVKEFAAISGTTPAAPDYGDTITIIGAGTF